MGRICLFDLPSIHLSRDKHEVKEEIPLYILLFSIPANPMIYLLHRQDFKGLIQFTESLGTALFLPY